VVTATATKQRDMPEGGSVAYRLHQVLLGQDQDGDQVTSCVVEAIEGDTPKAKKSSKPLNEEYKGWLRDIAALMAEPHIELVQPELQMQPVKAASRDGVRDWLKQRGRFSVTGRDALTDADRQKMLRVLNALRDKGKIHMAGELVWLA
jgi:hypothetical protein